MEQLDMNSVQSAAAFADAPNSLGGILEPDAALAAARRMQRWYQTPQGVTHSMFGRDGRRVEGRLHTASIDRAEPDAELGLEFEAEAEIETEADE
ncbi:MAG: hypothetical protein ACK5PW_00430 [Burkholderiales bacterium]|jgi:hypothetical protein